MCDCSDEGRAGCAAQTPGGSAVSELLLFLCQTREKKASEVLEPLQSLMLGGGGLTCLLLRKGDVGVHQTPSDAAENKQHKDLIPHQSDQSRGRLLPDIQA